MISDYFLGFFFSKNVSKKNFKKISQKKKKSKILKRDYFFLPTLFLLIKFDDKNDFRKSFYFLRPLTALLRMAACSQICV